MPTHAAFLRGVNLGARRKASADDLRGYFEGLGYEEVATFRTSGNVVFATPRRSRAKLRDEIEHGLAEALGFDVTVFLRDANELRELVAERPFPARVVQSSKGKLQVALLKKRPSPRARERVLESASDEDRLAFGRRELFWLPRGGISESKLGMAGIEKLVGPATVRTMGTIEQLYEKFFSG